MNDADRSLHNLAEHAAQRWQNAMALILGADLQQRREWTGREAIATVLGQLVTGMRGVQLVTPLHYVPTPADRRPETTGVEAWASHGVAVDVTADDQPVLRLTAPRDRTSWMAPSTLTYFPSVEGAQHGIFVLRVANPASPPVQCQRKPSDLLAEPTAPASFPRWIDGGVIFAAEGSRLRRSAALAPPSTYNDFEGLVAWALELIATPTADAGEPTGDDPTVLATLRRALAQHREHAQRQTATRLDQSDVDAIAVAAVAVGVQPTVRLVTNVANGGSPNVINPLLRSFWARASREGLLGGGLSPPVTPVPEALLALYQDLRTAARDAGEAALNPTRDALTARERELAERDEALTQRANALDAAEAVAAAAREQMAAQIQDLQTQREQDREALATAQRMAQADATALGEVRADLAASREAASKLGDEFVRLGSLVDQGKKREATLTAERDAARQDVADLQTKVTTLGVQYKHLERTERQQRAANEVLGKRWDSERAAHEATRERLTREKNQLAVRAGELEGQLTAVARERERTEVEVQRLRDDLTRLNVEIDRLSAERDRSAAAVGPDSGAPAVDA